MKQKEKEKETVLVRFPNGDLYCKKLIYNKHWKYVKYYLRVGDKEIRHRDKHPAVYNWQGKNSLTLEFWDRGQLHREDGPAIIEYYMPATRKKRVVHEEWYVRGRKLTDVFIERRNSYCRYRNRYK